MTPRRRLDAALARLPLLGVLRGLTPAEAGPVGDALAAGGLPILEVPLNSPDPLESIRTLSARHGERVLIGAGTLLRPEQVARVAEAGGRIVVSPDFKAEVVAETLRAGLISVPGVFTPTEAFAALDAGATALKLFPGDALSPRIVGALRAVLPPEALILVAGGVDAGNIKAFLAAGADGAAIGSALYRPGRNASELAAAARRIAAAARPAEGVET